MGTLREGVGRVREGLGVLREGVGMGEGTFREL